MDVQLTPEQRDLLLELVDEEMLELGPEIHHTRTRTYREGLKDRRSILTELRAHLIEAAPAVAPGAQQADQFSAT